MKSRPDVKNAQVGLMDGAPPTGRKVSYPGASFVPVEGDKIRSEQVYVDRQTVAEMLGLKAK
jgi:predicted ester cyclase